MLALRLRRIASAVYVLDVALPGDADPVLTALVGGDSRPDPLPRLVKPALVADLVPPPPPSLPELRRVAHARDWVPAGGPDLSGGPSVVFGFVGVVRLLLARWDSRPRRAPPPPERRGSSPAPPAPTVAGSRWPGLATAHLRQEQRQRQLVRGHFAASGTSKPLGPRLLWGPENGTHQTPHDDAVCPESLLYDSAHNTLTLVARSVSQPSAERTRKPIDRRVNHRSGRDSPWKTGWVARSRGAKLAAAAVMSASGRSDEMAIRVGPTTRVT